jgi:hypothetical protein
MPISQSFLFTTDASELAGILIALMLITMYLGYLLAKRRQKKHPDLNDESSSTILGALLALLGLILAFTFSMSGSRYDDRRKIITEEANDIGTAILRCDLYPQEVRNELREAFKPYLEARIAYLEVGIDVDKVAASLIEKDKHAAKIWEIATTYSKENPSDFVTSNQMIQALNAMIDVTTTRLALDTARVPELIVYLMFILSVVSSFYGGYMFGHKGKIDWVVAVGFAVVISVVVYTTLDLERTRRGVTNLNANNRYIIELRDLLKEP